VADALLLFYVNVKVATMTDAAARLECFIFASAESRTPCSPSMMLTPSSGPNDTPETSSKQTTSYANQSAYCPLALLTEASLATVAFARPRSNGSTAKSAGTGGS